MPARDVYIGAFLDNCHQQEMDDFPKARRTLKGWPDVQLHEERREMLKASFDRMFGMNAKKMLNIIEDEIQLRNGERNATS